MRARFVDERLATGERQPPLPDDLKTDLAKRGLTAVAPTLELCVDRAGAITQLELASSSGDARVDAIAMEAVWRWRFSPSATAPSIVCTVLTFRWELTEETQAVADAPRAPEGTVVRPITVVEKKMIAGVREPHLSDAMREGFLAAGVREPRVLAKLCIDASGIPDLVEVRTSSGMPAADQLVVDTLHGWRFAPHVNASGTPTRLCTAVMFRWRLGG